MSDGADRLRSNTYSNSLGIYSMTFDRIVELARTTPTSALCAAWEAGRESALDCIKGKRPMTVREAGALAELHGMKLLDILAI